jgi:glycosyltransferase involved in cell wall biosynthesis
MENKLSISLIIPCYNEETNLQKGVLDKIGNFTQNKSHFIEVIIVDDGSSDRSREIVSRYLKLFPKFRLLKNKHQGKAYAIISGIKSSRGNYVFFSDIDLATPIEEADWLVDKITEGYHIIIGSRKSNRQGAPILRKILSFGANIIPKLLFNFKHITDTQCGFKLFEKKAALHIINHSQLFQGKRDAHGPSVTAAFDLEFLFLAFKYGYKVREVPVLWKHVETRNVNFLKDATETLSDILKIKYYDIKGLYDKK